MLQCIVASLCWPPFGLELSLLFAFDNPWEPQKKNTANESGTIPTRWWWIEAKHEGKLSEHTIGNVRAMARVMSGVVIGHQGA
jgi:hypothetical protein